MNTNWHINGSSQSVTEAIKVGWLKKWWHPKLDRPDWAYVANELVYQSTQQKPAIAHTLVKEWICQTWPVKIRLEQLLLSLREMIDMSQKYNVAISVMRAPVAKVVAR